MNRLRETVAKETGQTEFTRGKGGVKRLDNIVAALEDKLKKHLNGDKHGTVQRLELGKLLEDRFY